MFVILILFIRFVLNLNKSEKIMGSAKERLLKIFISNVGIKLSRDVLNEAAGIYEWARVIRILRQEGWEIETMTDGYILHSTTKKNVDRQRVAINSKLRYTILQRDNSTCQRCGKTIKDGFKLEVDHKIPVEWGGTNDPENLWTLCNECNGGKKHFFSDFDQQIMASVMKEKSASQKLIKMFTLMPNVVIEPIKLQVISGIRDWTRTIRDIREKKEMNITFVKKCDNYPKGGYIYII